MRSFTHAAASFMVLLGILAPFPAHSSPDEGKTDRDRLEKVSAGQALEIANQWRWSKKEINSYLNAREVGFRFPDRTIKKIPLPDEKMVVAVAPYLQRTHG